MFNTALDAIMVFIRSFLPQATIKQVSAEELSVSNGGKTIRLPFNRGSLEELLGST